MRSTERALGIFAAGLLAGAAFVAGPSPAAAQDLVIKMAVPDWPPTRIMQDLANEQYKSPSGKNVKLEADFIPWPVYYERLAASLTSGEKKYQMAVSDSQWLGAFVEGGYYKQINEFVEKDPELQAIFKDLHPNLVASYSTYPHKSENLYGFPQMPDVLIVYYRKDLFCDPGEQAAYQAKYGQKLPCDPAEMDNTDWAQVKNYGEFFRRDKGDKLAGQTLDDDFYGIAYQSGKDYDFAIMQVNAFIWQNGGRHLGRDPGAERAGEGRGQLAEGDRGPQQLLGADRVHAARGQDRDHGHLQDRRVVPRGQGRLDHPVDRVRREHDQPRRPRRSPTRSLSPSIRVHPAPTASCSAGRTSAASPSC